MLVGVADRVLDRLGTAPTKPSVFQFKPGTSGKKGRDSLKCVGAVFFLILLPASFQHTCLVDVGRLAALQALDNLALAHGSSYWGPGQNPLQPGKVFKVLFTFLGLKLCTDVCEIDKVLRCFGLLENSDNAAPRSKEIAMRQNNELLNNTFGGYHL